MRNPPSSSATASKTTPCCSKVGLKRGPWTPEEDALLSNYIAREGEGRWRTLPKRANLLRCGKSCRLRWMNYLRPSVKRGHIAPDEEDLILRLHRLLGNRWSLIAGRIPGRTDNEIKNYWNTHLSKKLISQGIDPRTHKPMNPNPNTHAAEPAPKPNPNPKSSALKENSSSVTNLAEKDKSIRNTWILSDADEKLENYDRPATENENLAVEEDDMESLTDDVFSSFLNSLINEDMFLQQQQQQQNVDGSSEHLVSSITNFGSHAFWEDASSSPARVENEDSCRHDERF